VGDVPDGSVFALSVSDQAGYDYRIFETGTSNPCRIIPGSGPSEYIRRQCTLDVPELDLYGNGLYFDFTVPAGACDYVVYWHYMFLAWEAGVGPTDVSYDIDLVGNISNEVNSVGGNPVCAFDHQSRHPDAPNCCVGTYTITVTNTDTGAVDVSPPQFWGGRLGDCYEGAAYWDPNATFTEDGFPTAKIVFTDNQAWENLFQFDALSKKYWGNVTLANYYDPADHGGTRPAGLADLLARPFYTFQCYDHAEELRGELRLIVREWNEEAQFVEADPNTGSGVGDPDTEGREPISGTPINDRTDWRDATPGNVDYIEFAQ
jgi:hypothetical protein